MKTRSLLCNEVISKVARNGGRFIEQIKDDSWTHTVWFLVIPYDDKRMLDKVKNSFRKASGSETR